MAITAQSQTIKAMSRTRRKADKSEQPTYLAVRLHFENAVPTHAVNERHVSAATLQHMVSSMIQMLFGSVDGAFSFDIIKFEESSLKAVFSVASSHASQLCGALVFCNEHQGEPCALRVETMTTVLTDVVPEERLLSFVTD
jgi:RNase P/RNase MRP subunit POP5